MLEARIAQLEDKLRSATVIDVTGSTTDIVCVGTVVHVVDGDGSNTMSRADAPMTAKPLGRPVHGCDIVGLSRKRSSISVRGTNVSISIVWLLSISIASISWSSITRYEPLRFVASALVAGLYGFTRLFVNHCCRSRFPVFLLICRNATRSPDDEAAQRPMGHDTKASLI